MSEDSTLIAGPETTWSPKDNFVGATDAEGNDVPFENVNVNGTVNPQVPGEYTVEYDYTGLAGNKVVSQAKITVVASKSNLETQDSSIISGPNIKWKPEDNFVGGKDATGKDIPLSEVTVTGSVDPLIPGDYEVEYSYTDEAGNKVTSKVTIKVVPTQVNVVSKDSILIAGPKTTWSPEDNFVSANDAKGYDVPLSEVTVIGTVNPKKAGIYEVEYSYVGSAGNRVVSIAKVTVLDSKATIESKDSTFIGGPKSEWKPEDNFVSATDATGKDIPFSDVTVTGTVDPKEPGNYEIEYKYTDDAGNEVVSKVVVTVLPTQVSVSSKDSLLIAGPTAEWSQEDNFISANDAEGYDVPFSEVTVNGTVKPKVAGTYEVEYSYVGSAGNKAISKSVVTVVASQADIQTRESTLIAGPSTTWDPKDNFAGLKDMNGESIPFSEVKVTGSVDTSTPGTYDVVYSYTDEVGNEVSSKVIITVVASKVAIESKNSILYIGPNTKWGTKDNFVSGKDARGDELAFSEVEVVGSVDPTIPGNYEVEYSYTGSAGNKVTSKATITVKTSEAKVEGKDGSLVAGDDATWNPEDNFVEAKDAEGNDVPFSKVEVTGSVNPKVPGDYEIEYKYTDEAGNEQTSKVIITVVENKGKVISKHVDEQGNTICPDIEQEGRVGDSYAVGATTISGYALDSSKLPKNAMGVYTTDSITVTYVYKKIDAPVIKTTDVTIQFVDTKGEKIADDIIQTGKVGDTYATGAKTIPGYALDSTQLPKNSVGTYADDSITVTYVYKKIDAPITEMGTVTAQFVDQNGQSIADSVLQTGQVGDAYVTGYTPIEGYALDLEQLPANTIGTYTSNPITVVYVYKKIDAPVTEMSTVTTQFVDESGQKIADNVTQTGYVGDTYVAGSLAISGYALDATNIPANAMGVYTTEPTVVTYVYKKVEVPSVETGTVTTQFVDETGQSIATDNTQTGSVGDTYVTSSISIEGYALDVSNIPVNVSGTYTLEPITVTYVYKKIENPVVEKGTVTTQFVDENRQILSDSVIQSGNVGDTYATGSVSIEGYALDASKIPANVMGIYTTEPITVTYVYKKVEVPVVEKGTVITQFVDGSGQAIAENITQTGNVGDAYATGSIVIAGYALDESKLPENVVGTYSVEPITVTYVYKKIEAPVIEKGTVITQFVDENGKSIAEERSQTGNVGESYMVGAATIPGYVLDSSKTPNNSTGQYTAEQIKVTYHYKKISANKDEQQNEKVVDKTNSTNQDVSPKTTSKSTTSKSNAGTTLPHTGSKQSYEMTLTGIVLLFMSMLGIKNRRKKTNN